MKKSFCVVLCVLLVASVFAYAQNNKKAPSVRPKISAEDPFGADADPAGGTDPFAADPNPFDAPPAKKARRAPDPFGANEDADPFGGAPQPRPPRRPAIQAKAKPAGPARPTSQRFPVTWLHGSAVRERIETALDEKTTFDYLDQPLDEILEDISYRHELPIHINVRSLDDFGIATDTPVTISLKGVSLRSALKLALEPLELTYIIRDEVMMITTPEEAEAQLAIGFYRVSELLPENGDTEWLVKLITWIVAPDTWDEVGGAGSIVYIDHLETLLISQTDEIHTEVQRLLGKLSELPKKGQ